MRLVVPNLIKQNLCIFKIFLFTDNVHSGVYFTDNVRSGVNFNCL